MWWREKVPVSVSELDPVVADARARKAEAERQLEVARNELADVEQRRREAAALLATSQEAERRNHFAEAIVASMRK